MSKLSKPGPRSKRRFLRDHTYPPVAMNLIFIVPARGGSKRLPRKNIRELAGKTLLGHTASAIAESGLAGPVVLTTDDAGIAEEGRRLGWTVPFLRPPELATDTASTESAVFHVLDWHRDTHGGRDPDALVLLQPTSPLRGGACIRDAVDMLLEDPSADGAVSMTSVHLPPAHFYTMESDGTASPLSQRHDAPVYYPNGAVYAVRTASFRERETFYGGKTKILPMPAWRSIDIDTQEDWDIAEALLIRQSTSPIL